MTVIDEVGRSEASEESTPKPGLLRRVARGIVRCVAGSVRVLPRVARSAGGRPRLSVAILVSLVVLLGATGGYFWNEQREADLADDARLVAIETATTQIPRLLSYDGKSVTKVVDQADDILTDKFSREYKELLRNVVVPAVRQHSIATTTEVVASSVVEAGAGKVVCMLFVNQSTTAKGQDSPKVQGSRVQVDLEKAGTRWLISGITPL